MSTGHIQEEIRKFLRSNTPEVLCIRGNWGTGKTYSWTDVLKDASSRNAVGLKRYAYVSLFGLNSLQDVKQEVFQRTIDIKRIGEDFDTNDVKRNYELANEVFKLGNKIFEKVTGGTGAAQSIASLMVRDQVICIDDLERKGDKLQAGEVLGYISQLRHDRGCKVVLLLNDFNLSDKSEFESYLEKVVDINLRFAPSAEECAIIALPGGERVSELVRRYSVALGIDNIRVIRKIHRLVSLIEDQLQDFEPDVLDSVAKSITLFGWSHYQPHVAPSIAYLREQQSPWADLALSHEMQTVDLDPKEEAWKSTLRKYGHSYSDDLDLVLIQGVMDGYFSRESLELHARHLHERTRLEAANWRMREAIFEAYDYSFIKTQDEAVRIIAGQFEADILNLGLEWLNYIAKLFRKMGLHERVRELVDFYFDKRRDAPGAFNYFQLTHHGSELEEDILSRCKLVVDAQKPNYDTDEVLLKLGNTGTDNELLAKLIDVPVGEYVRIFMSYEGQQLASRLQAVSNPLRISNPTPLEEVMMDRAGEALRIISAQSDINAARALRWGLIQRLDSKHSEASEN